MEKIKKPFADKMTEVSQAKVKSEEGVQWTTIVYHIPSGIASIT
jgi:hypothetical protein